MKFSSDFNYDWKNVCEMDPQFLFCLHMQFVNLLHPAPKVRILPDQLIIWSELENLKV